MSAFDNFMAALFPGVVQRRQQAALEQLRGQITGALQPFGPQQTPFSAGQGAAMGGAGMATPNPLGALQEAGTYDMLANIETPGLFTREQIPALAQILTTPGLQEFGGKMLESMIPQAQKPTTLMQNVSQLAQPGTPEYMKIMRDAILKPQVQINQAASKPLLESSKNWRNSAGQSPAPTETAESAYAKGFAPLTGEEIKTQTATKGAASSIGKLFSYAFGKNGSQPESLFPPDDESAMNRLMGAAQARYSQVTKSDKNLVLYNSQKEAFLSNLARIKGQSGTLTDVDIGMVRQLFPEAGLTPYSTAKEQFKVMAAEIIAKGISKQQLLDAGFPSWAFGEVPIPAGYKKVSP